KKLKIFKNYPLSTLSTFNIGGKANYFTFVEDQQQIFEVLEHSKKAGLKPFFFGNGANILFPDKPDRDTIFISTRKFIQCDIKENEVSFSSGFPLSLISLFYAALNIPDGCFFYLLPGSVGAAAYMNVRYFEHDFSEVVKYVEYIDLDDFKIKKISGKDCQFSYKDSIFQKKSWLILNIFLNIRKNPISQLDHSIFTANKYNLFIKFATDNLLTCSNLSEFYQFYNLKNITKLFEYFDDACISELHKIEQDRVSKKHFSYPNCGSVFKNNHNFGTPTGVLVDRLKLKGLAHNDAMIAPFHGNIIINTGKARQNDVLYLIDLIKDKIYSNFGFVPETEIVIIK
ncbi:MAG: UDP-N-acetylmuramate dehydrogenase, partial [Exilispira sp.]|nr:UDP-N-acetylmuramate dehydrogenase [Exilispira sp.]